MKRVIDFLVGETVEERILMIGIFMVGFLNS